MAPFERPVVPEVYKIAARSSPLRSTVTKLVASKFAFVGSDPVPSEFKVSIAAFSDFAIGARPSSLLSSQITKLAQARYTIDSETRQEIVEGLGDPNKPLGNKLTAWWELDFPALRAEVKKRFKREIAVKERKEWRDYHGEQQAAHQRLTQQIILQETRLNAIVYQLFNLTPEEIALIESSTKYPYSAV